MKTTPFINPCHLFLFVLLLAFGPSRTYAQKELWGTVTTSPLYILPVYYNNGAVVKTDSIGNILTVVHVFDSVNGRVPNATLLQASNGKIYGTTGLGGFADGGTLFEYDPAIDSFRVLVKFGEPAFPYSGPVSGLIEGSPGILYGEMRSGGQIFTYDIAANTIHFAISLPFFSTGILTQQVAFSGPLYKASDGYIYGTANYSDYPAGFPNVGSVVRIDPATNVFSILYPFIHSGVYGSGPVGGLVERAGKLYGLTYNGGIYGSAPGNGVVFEYDISSGTYTKKMDFKDSTGTHPFVPFLKAASGKYYGYTFGGIDALGSYDETLYEYDPATNVESRKYGFSSATYLIGVNPTTLMQASNGKLYGSCERGLFEYDIAGNSMRSAASFTLGTWQKLVEICRKPAYKYFGNGGDTICSGSSFSFDLHCSNATSFAWMHNGVADPSQTTGILSLSPAAVADSGTWVCTMTNECGTTTTSIHLTVATLPLAGVITGAATVCVGAAMTLSDAVTGGAWTSGSTSIATVGPTGVVNGVAAGTAVISYTLSGSCGTAFTSHSVIVNPLPSAGSISGVTNVCELASTTLTDPVAGGTWSSGATSIVTVGPTGIVTGVSTGTTSISYVVANSCGTATATTTVTVDPLPVAGTIMGTATLCPGLSSLLTDMSAGGIWSSGSTGIASIVSTGSVTAIAAGTTIISYTVANGCGTAVATHSLTVDPLPDAGIITGVLSVCAGSSSSLSDTAAGGVWSSAPTSIATITTTGVVTGISMGTASISYTVVNSCGTARAVSLFAVNPLPDAGTITGILHVCVAGNTALSNLVTGGTWSSSTPSLATVSGTGLVSGLVAGTCDITYSMTNGCGTAVTSVTVTIDPLPYAGTITGSDSVCIMESISLTASVGGGTWSSSLLTTIVDVSGMVTGVSAGIDTIKYTVTNSCGSVYAAFPVLVGSFPGCLTAIGPIINPLDDGVTIYPNPASKTFTVWSKSAGIMNLFSIEGRKEGMYHISAGTNSLNLPEGLAAGVYFVNFVGEGETNNMVKLIVEP